ncbi:putative RNA-binding protein [Leptomonas pyrrhocoris]|uniref:Putative RNA-binding protein n=1 Tax=Leptomonas pyrrhocoris TaxID=157538 RepID=A0A0M9FVI5_LEPPY|nr:putative RNA-binding protein [Leptomonas pyrrhocoris]KPA76746.1 putative RNA-binding protein [Leptomonas pyrrhocoris]|eukprot:XP_015655185.1 putative RNA-binding protein [Leptomonas pyrrhocoris]
MDDRLVQTSCRTADFASVEATLRKWSEVEAVGSFREKNNNKKDLTTVFVTFRDEESAKAAKAKLVSIPGIVDPSQHEDEKVNQNKTSQKKNKNLAAEFLKYESYEDKKQPESKKKNEKASHDEQTAATKSRGGRGGRGNRGGRGGRGAARGGRGSSINNNSHNSGSNNNRGGRGGNRGVHERGGMQQYQQPRLPPFEANVAFVDNVPFGTTNSYLMERFSAFGRILDVNRLELMVMICYDNPESVQQCIQHMNGAKIHDNFITVSSGTVRIPGSVAIQMGI